MRRYREPIWTGRKRPAARGGKTFFTWQSGKRKITAPKGYAFNKRGDLINLRREEARRG